MGKTVTFPVTFFLFTFCLVTIQHTFFTQTFNILDNALTATALERRYYRNSILPSILPSGGVFIIPAMAYRGDCFIL